MGTDAEWFDCLEHDSYKALNTAMRKTKSVKGNWIGFSPEEKGIKTCLWTVSEEVTCIMTLSKH